MAKDLEGTSPPFFRLSMVPCSSAPVTRLSRSLLCETMRKNEAPEEAEAVPKGLAHSQNIAIFLSFVFMQNKSRKKCLVKF